MDEVPSSVYLYPEEESGTDNIFCPFQGRPNATQFEEAQKEMLKLMRIEVFHYSYSSLSSKMNIRYFSSEENTLTLVSLLTLIPHMLSFIIRTLRC